MFELVRRCSHDFFLLDNQAVIVGIEVSKGSSVLTGFGEMTKCFTLTSPELSLETVLEEMKSAAPLLIGTAFNISNTRLRLQQNNVSQLVLGGIDIAL